MGRGHPQIMGYASFECSDGAYVTVGAFSETFWGRLCVLIGHEDWLQDQRLATNARRLDHREIIDGELAAIFRRKPRREWVTLLSENDVPCAPVLELDEALVSEQALHNKAAARISDGGYDYSVINSPIRSGQWADPSISPAEDLGASTRQVLAEVLGMGPDEVDDLIAGAVAHESSARINPVM
jgi:crotonobetainyl-CoA:carnitine CoA-transferase CaiB-like acyl-CoA transferase